MKKKYIAPQTEVVRFHATNMLLAGSYGGKVSSREIDDEEYEVY